ncbi:tetronasin resistance protein [Companilactobacillus zhachilii]|uniref:Tetronasin resistance protein n=1 Tax=Companilactobacillus zhachilii TaxID=2304606 RepID=A0A386PR51_9LACO|nr:tetronasin resistance protein [Companilactobacillus zhachilii]AYE37143.1 tetronasin resistance protein [Companilactobacillus zhachilii]
MREKFARWDTLFLQYLKRDWRKIVIWIIGLGLFSGAFVPAFKELAKGNGLRGMYETMQNPAMISMVGPTPIKNAANYTIGAMYSNEMLLFCGLFAMIMSALHVVSHTRKEEDLGLTELVRSFKVGRQANSVAVVLETIIINVVLGLFTSGVMLSFGLKSLSTEGIFLFGTAIAMAGLVGAAIGILMAQIMPNASGATGSSIGIIGLLYIIRAGTDVSNLDYSVWNPMSWIYLTYPFTKNDWLPIVYGISFLIVIGLVSFVLEGNRDMGSGYVHEFQGKAHANFTMLSIPGFLLRLSRGIIISWLVGFAVMGAAYGSIYGDMQEFLNSSPLVKQMFTMSGHSIEESFTSTIMMVMIVLATILPIVLINKLFTEESHGRMSQTFSTKVTRGKLYWSTISLAIIMGAIGIFISAGTLGETAISSMSSKSVMEISDFLKAGFNFFPSMLFFIGLAGLALGWAPKLSKLAYIYLIYSFMLNYFSGILDLPDWFNKTSIQTWIPRMPIDKFDGSTFATITVISLVMIVAGYIGYRRRDLIEGA